MFLPFSYLFHEQMAVAMPAFLLSYGVLQFIAQRSVIGAVPWVYQLLVTIAAGALVIFAPGNFIRRAVSEYPHEIMVETLLANISSMSHLTLHPEGRLALLVWGAAGLIYAALVIMTVPKPKYALIAMLLGGALVAGLAGQGSALFLPALLMLFMAVFMAGVYWRCIPVMVAAAFLSAVASLVLLLVAPVVAARSLLTFYCLMLVPLTYAGVIAWRWSPFLFMMVVLAFAVPTVDKARLVYQGYAQNVETHQLNGAKLLVAGVESQAGNAPEQIVLYKLPNERFAETMAYQRPLVETWMRRYYQVPTSTEIEWRDPLEQQR